MSAPSPPPTLANPLLTASEVAVILHVSLRTVRRLITSNELEAVRIGRSVRVQDSVLQAFIERSARR
jgi:excisionase family DNA binding protein